MADESGGSYVYALVDPRTHRVRYIGKADNPKSRLNSHIAACHTLPENHPKRVWIEELLSQYLTPQMVILEYIREERVLEAEGKWVRIFEQQNDLTNVQGTREPAQPLEPQMSAGDFSYFDLVLDLCRRISNLQDDDKADAIKISIGLLKFHFLMSPEHRKKVRELEGVYMP